MHLCLNNRTWICHLHSRICCWWNEEKSWHFLMQQRQHRWEQVGVQNLDDIRNIALQDDACGKIFWRMYEACVSFFYNDIKRFCLIKPIQIIVFFCNDISLSLTLSSFLRFFFCNSYLKFLRVVFFCVRILVLYKYGIMW